MHYDNYLEQCSICWIFDNTFLITSFGTFSQIIYLSIIMFYYIVATVDGDVAVVATVMEKLKESLNI